MLRKCIFLILLLTVVGSPLTADAQEKALEVTTGVDLYNRYVWRGLDIAATPSIQPTLAVSYGCLEFGTWGAYTLSNQASESDEIDFWLAYTADFNSGASLSLIATDYYFPNAGIEFFNFNNHDEMIDDTIPDPGAHLIELGASFTGPESFPITLSGYVNVYNEAGSNTYFQVDYPVVVNGTALDLFCGATGGSADNPDYYGSDDLAIINLGVTAYRDIEISETFSLPLSVSFIMNPKEEKTHILVGVSF